MIFMVNKILKRFWL